MPSLCLCCTPALLSQQTVCMLEMHAFTKFLLSILASGISISVPHRAIIIKIEFYWKFLSPLVILCQSIYIYTLGVSTIPSQSAETGEMRLELFWQHQDKYIIKFVLFQLQFVVFDLLLFAIVLKNGEHEKQLKQFRQTRNLEIPSMSQIISEDSLHICENSAKLWSHSIGYSIPSKYIQKASAI